VTTASTASPAVRLLLVVASTRTGRFADHPLAWLQERLGARTELDVEVLDVRDHPMPFYDLPRPPALAQRAYTTDAERALGERLDAADAYLVLTNEFNHGYSAALKNLLDHFYAEFRHKPMAFVGYGNVGGARAIEQLRQVAAELDMVSVRETVNILGQQMAVIREAGALPEDVTAFLDPRLAVMLDNLVWWSRALTEARRSG
jgi:NAD(P)H-dependent FMN reductase